MKETATTTVVRTYGADPPSESFCLVQELWAIFEEQRGGEPLLLTSGENSHTWAVSLYRMSYCAVVASVVYRVLVYSIIATALFFHRHVSSDRIGHALCLRLHGRRIRRVL